jgi:hypothetical protein
MSQVLYAALPEFLGGLTTTLVLLAGGAVMRALRARGKR